MTQSLPRISIVIPVYNSEAIIPDLISRIRAVMPDIASSYEIILVNDGSHDRSWDVIAKIAKDHNMVHGINLMRNYGQHNALLCGIRAAKYDLIVTMDDDLQHPPEEISKLINELDEGYDVVYGTPMKERHGIWRDLASITTKLAMQSVMGIDNAKKVGAFRIFKRQLRNSFANYSSPFISIDVLLTWGTTKFSAIPVNHNIRNIGKSNYTLSKLIIQAVNMIIGFGTFPLRVASIIGFFFTVFGMLVLAYVIYGYLNYGGIVPGFAFLASMIAIFSGAQLFSLGVIGEYLSRMYFRTMERPVYTIREEITFEH
jgi:glycosyltransferase involved in cell wall biosynthesis